MLGHAAKHAPQPLDRGVDLPERVQRAAVARAPRVGGDVVVEVVDVDRRHARVDVARDRQGEELAQPHRDPELDRQPLPAGRRRRRGIGEHPEQRASDLDGRRHRSLHEDPGDHHHQGSGADQPRPGRTLDHREGQQIAGGAAREDASVGAAAVHDTPPARRLGPLDVRRVAAAREVDVGLAALVVVVESRDVRAHTVHRGQLEGRRRGRKPRAHRYHLIATPVEQTRQERHAPPGDRVLEYGAREPVDLHDQQAALAGHRRRPQSEPADDTIERSLQTEDEVVERHGPLL